MDLPGYGYAKAPKTDIKAWTKLTRQFLSGRASLQRMFLLIDARRGVGPGDEEMMKLMDEAAVPWAAVLTKMDKVKIAEQGCEKTTRQVNRHVAAYPHVWPTSSETARALPSCARIWPAIARHEYLYLVFIPELYYSKKRASLTPVAGGKKRMQIYLKPWNEARL